MTPRPSSSSKCERASLENCFESLGGSRARRLSSARRPRRRRRRLCQFYTQSIVLFITCVGLAFPCHPLVNEGTFRALVNEGTFGPRDTAHNIVCTEAPSAPNAQSTLGAAAGGLLRVPRQHEVLDDRPGEVCPACRDRPGLQRPGLGRPYWAEALHGPRKAQGAVQADWRQA